jgi:hypothetical protein
MYNFSAALGVLFGLLYVSGQHEIGSIGDDVCRYGGTLCDSRNPGCRLGQTRQRPLTRIFTACSAHPAAMIDSIGP